MTDDLISRQAAIDTIKDADVCVCYSENESVEIEDVIDLAIRATKGSVIASIEQMPAVDAVPVIRCKDCRYWDTFPSSSIAPEFHKCKGLGVHTVADFFCSKGERTNE